jgi:hypothetical protein
MSDHTDYPSGVSVLTLNAGFSRGESVYAFKTEFPSLVDCEADVEDFLTTATTTALKELRQEMTRVSQPRKAGRFQHVAAILRDMGTPGALSMLVDVHIGDLGMIFESTNGDEFPMSFLSIEHLLDAFIPSIGADLYRQFTKIGADNGFRFDPSAHGYVRARRTRRPRAGLEALLGELFGSSGFPGGGGFGARTGGPGFGVFVGGSEELAQFLEANGIPYDPAVFGERRGARKQQQEVPEGSFICRDNGQVMEINDAVQRLQAIRAEQGGKLNRKRVADFYDPIVLEALDQADNAVGSYPLEDGGIAPIPEGQFWDRETGELKPIPNGYYVHDGDLGLLPDGAIYDNTLHRLVATQPFHFVDLHKHTLARIPFGMYVGASGYLDELERGFYLLADGTIERVPEGKYPTPDGTLEDLPADQFFNYKTWSLEPVPEGFTWDWATSTLKRKEAATAE